MSVFSFSFINIKTKMIARMSHFVLLLGLFIARPALAASTDNLPWDGVMDKVTRWLTGDVAHAIIIIAIFASGISFAMGEQGGGFRKGAGIVFGGSIACGAATLVSMMGFSGAVI